MVRITYNTSYDQHTGDVSFVTDCQHEVGIKVGSDECFRCRHFKSFLNYKQQVECGKDENGVFLRFGELSEPQPHNSTPATKKPHQMQIFN